MEGFFFSKAMSESSSIDLNRGNLNYIFPERKRKQTNGFFSSFRSFFVFLMTQNWVTFQTGGTKRSKQWLKELYIDEIVTFEATLDLVFSSMCTDDTCMQVYKAIFFCIKKKNHLCIHFSQLYTHTYTHTLLKMLACTDLFWSVNRHGYFIILINTMDCSFFGVCCRNDLKSFWKLEPEKTACVCIRMTLSGERRPLQDMSEHLCCYGDLHHHSSMAVIVKE